MKFPVVIVNKPNELGHAIDINRINENVSRIYSENVLFLILKGQGDFLVNEKSYSLTVGAFFFLKKSTLLKINSEDLIVLKVYFSDFDLEEKQNRISIFSEMEKDALPYKELKKTLYQIIECQKENEKNVQKKVSILLDTLSYQILKYFCVCIGEEKIITETTKNRNNSSFLEVVNYIDNHYFENLLLKELAEKYYYTPSSLTKLFKKYTGKSFFEYITLVRLKKAEELLKKQKLSISIVAEKTGFPNTRAFQQSFQKVFGHKPSEYRDNIFADKYSEKPDVIKNNIIELDALKLFDEAFADLSVLEQEGTQQTSSEMLYEALGAFSVKAIEDIEINCKNSVLNIEDTKDLFLPKVQNQVLAVLRENRQYKYISAHNFFSDNLQIFFKDNFNEDLSRKPKTKRKLVFDFSYYELILDFVKSTGLHFQTDLGFIPSLLAKEDAKAEDNSQCTIGMPYSMEIWCDYIRQLFTFLLERYGEWILGCKFGFWQVPDVVIPLNKTITVDEYFYLYENTYKTIKSIDSRIILGAPTLTYGYLGLKFAERFLKYSKEHDCVPEFLNFVFFNTSTKTLSLKEDFNDQHLFVNAMNEVFNHLDIKQKIPMNITELAYGFGYGNINDAALNCIFPIKVIINNRNYFENFGIWCIQDFSTTRALPEDVFSGRFGIINKKGGKKAVYIALQLMSMLGDKLVAEGENYLITIRNTNVLVLLYYDVPKDNYPFLFSGDRVKEFYECIPEKRMNFELVGIKNSTSANVIERYINYAEGSGYERWLEEKDNTKEYSSTYIVKRDKVDIENGVIKYNAVLKPFEVRLVEFIDLV